MRALVLILLAQLTPPAPAPAPAPPVTPPAATTPATARIATVEREPLLDGSIRYIPPPAADGWKFLGKADDNKKASYELEGGKGRIDITVTPQSRDVPDEYARQMAL